MGRNGVGRPGKIDLFVMQKLLKEGKTQTEVARHFNVSRSAVNQAKSAISKALTKNVVMESAARIVNSEIDAVEQMTHSNRAANEILDDLMAQIRGTKNPEMGKKDLRDLALKALAEVRRQLSQQADIFSKIVDFQAVAEFRQEVIDIILGEVSNEQRQRIVSRLKERRIVRSTLRLSK